MPSKMRTTEVDDPVPADDISRPRGTGGSGLSASLSRTSVRSSIDASDDYCGMPPDVVRVIIRYCHGRCGGGNGRRSLAEVCRAWRRSLCRADWMALDAQHAVGTVYSSSTDETDKTKRIKRIVKVALDPSTEWVTAVAVFGALSPAHVRAAIMDASAMGNCRAVMYLVGLPSNFTCPCGSCDISSEAMVSAASRGHTELVRLLLHHRPQLLGRLDEVLYAAVRNGRIDPASYLLSWLPQHRKTYLLGDSMGYLVEAASNNDLAMARLLMDHGARADAHDSLALVEAAAKGYVDMVDMLLDWPVHAAEPDCENGIAFIHACGAGHLDIATKLILRGVPPDCQEGRALIEAASNGELETVRFLLRCGVSANVRNGSAVVKAAAEGDVDSVRLLLDNGASVPEQAIMEAAAEGHLKVLDVLLAANSENVVVSIRGLERSLTEAVFFNRLQAVHLMLRCGIRGTAEALQAACRHDEHYEVCCTLLDVTKDVVAGDVLVAAARNGTTRQMHALATHAHRIGYGFSQHHAETALVEAARAGQVSAVFFVLQLGIRADARHGQALIDAARFGHLAVVRILIDWHNGHPALLHDRGIAALDEAVRMQHKHVLTFLVYRMSTEDELLGRVTSKRRSQWKQMLRDHSS